MRGTEDDEVHNLFKWEGPLDARKIVERFLAALSAGVVMAVVLIAYGVFFG